MTFFLGTGLLGRGISSVSSAISLERISSGNPAEVRGLSIKRMEDTVTNW